MLAEGGNFEDANVKANDVLWHEPGGMGRGEDPIHARFAISVIAILALLYSAR